MSKLIIDVFWFTTTISLYIIIVLYGFFQGLKMHYHLNDNNGQFKEYLHISLYPFISSSLPPLLKSDR